MSTKKSTNLYEYIAGTNIREPISGRESEYRPWEAPPLLASSENSEVLVHQAEVREMLMNLILYNLEKQNIKLNEAGLVKQDVFPDDELSSRDFQGNHEASLVTDPENELTEDQLLIFRKVEHGTADMAEIKESMRDMGRSSAELAMIRIIAGYRAEHTDPMMEELMAIIGSRFEPAEHKKYRVNKLLVDEAAGRLLAATVEFKQDLSTEKDDDGNLFGLRGKATLRLNTRAFNPNARSVLEKAALNGHAPVGVLKLRAIRDEICRIIEEGPSHPAVLAMTKKAYVYNPDNSREIDKRYGKVPKKGPSRKITFLDTDGNRLNSPNLSK